MHNDRTKEVQQHLRHLETLMKQSPEPGNGRKAPPSCLKCPYYQPDFKYRTCLYARCPFRQDINVFRKRPRRLDPLGRPKAVRLDV